MTLILRSYCTQATIYVMLHIAFYYITVNRRRRSPSINRDYMDKGIFAAAASEPEASEQGSRPTIFARNYGTAAVISYNLKGIAPPVPPVQCWIDKNLMSGCEAPTLKRVGGGRVGKMYQ